MSRWILPHPVAPQARVRLFCLPWAGGGASAYRPWCAALAPEIEVVPLQPPGRENRLREPAANDFAALMPDLVTLIADAADQPYALFGHSKGAHLAFTLTRALRAAGVPKPARLFLSARRAVHLPPEAAPIGELDDAALIACVRERYGGRMAIDDPALWQLLLPTLRADIQATETWLDADEPPLATPITALGATDDPWVSVAALRAWEQHTTGGFACHLFPGGHFYFQEVPDAVLAVLRHDLAHVGSAGV